MCSMSLEGVLTRAHRIHRDNADQEETQTWSVISELHSPAAATRPTIIASTENTLLADLEYFRPPGVLSRSSHSSRSSRASKASKDALLRLATAQTDMDKLLATQGLEREEDELRLREAELKRNKKLKRRASSTRLKRQRRFYAMEQTTRECQHHHREGRNGPQKKIFNTFFKV